RLPNTAGYLQPTIRRAPSPSADVDRRDEEEQKYVLRPRTDDLKATALLGMRPALLPKLLCVLRHRPNQGRQHARRARNSIAKRRVSSLSGGARPSDYLSRESRE